MAAFIEWLINFIKGLFGSGGKAPPASPALPQGAPAPAPAHPVAAPPQSAPPEPELDYVDEQWRELGQLVARVESGGVPLNGIDWRQPEQIWRHQFSIEEGMGQGYTADQAAQGIGYHSKDHFDTVLAYVSAKYSRIEVDEDGDRQIVQDHAFQNAMIAARTGQMQAQMQAKAAADPTLFEPVEGVSLEAYAGASAQLAALGQGATPQQVGELMARFGMDQATYDRAAAGWQAKMQADTSYALMTKYSEYFAAGQGQAGGWSVSQGGGGGAEPCSFEHYIEIMAAQEAWATSGMDVNAQLGAVFGIDAATYSRYASYWSPKMGADMALIEQYEPLRQKYLAKYQGAGLDDDLVL